MTLDKQLQIRQIDEELKKLRSVEMTKPRMGWIKTIRTALSMSAAQLSKRMGITQQALANLEKREAEETITIAKLRELGNKLDLELVYSFVPKSSLEDYINQRAREVATEIVMKTNQQMILEDQKIDDKKLQQAIKSRAEEIARKMPKYLWD